MKLYLLTRTDRWSYNEHDSFIVAAENEKGALEYLPNGNKRNEESEWA